MTDSTEARERFERVILPRVDKAVKAVELIGNGASRDYETTPEEIAELLNGVQQKLWEVQRRYATRLGCGTGLMLTAKMIFDTVEDGAAEGNLPAPQAETTPAPASTVAFLGLNRHRLPVFVDALDASLVAPLVTHLVNRLAEMAEDKGRAA